MTSDEPRWASSSIHFHGVTVRRGDVTVLRDVTAHVPPGTSTAIVGPNGAGKTSMLLALLGEIPATGEITITRDPSGRAPRIGYVPQRLDFDRGLPLSVAEFMALARQRRPLWFGVPKATRWALTGLLGAVSADHLIDRHLGALSGGELQRVLLALALQGDPQLLVLDEPTAGLDIQGESVFCELLDRLRSERGFTQLMVSHDLATVTHHADHVICLNRGVVAEGPPREVLTQENLARAFGIHMGLVNPHALAGDSPAACDCPKGTHD